MTAPTLGLVADLQPIKEYAYAYEFTRRRIGESLRAETPEQAAEFLVPLFAGAEQERLIVVLLDRKARTLGIEEVYRGTVSGSPVRIAEVFRAAVRVGASSILIAHNHPSGDPTPSADDMQTTRKIRAAGRMLDIDLNDHIVVGEGRWVSIRRMGGF